MLQLCRSVSLMVSILLLIDCSQSIETLVYPSTLPQCKAADIECLPRVMTSVIQLSAGGNKDLNVPPIDPLFLEKFSIVQNQNSPVNIQLHFRNLTLNGIKDLVIYKVVGFEKDPSKSKFEVFGRTKKLAIIGRYSIAGKVLFLPITGNGFANLTFENVDIHAKVVPKTETREGEEFIHIEKVKVDFKTTKFIPYFENLFNDKALSDNMNVFLQENSEDIFKEVKRSMQKAVGNVIKDVLSGPFDKFPYAKLFLPDDNAKE